MWKKEEDSVGTQPTLTTMTTYKAAVDKFTQSATAFMEQMHHLTQARDAYQKAMTASAELRNVLDAGDTAMRTLMTELEQAITVHLGKSAQDRKKPEAVNVEPIRRDNETTGVMKTLP